MLEELRSRLEKAQARAQEEVGRFLTLKARILRLPQGPEREVLKQRQDTLEARALGLMSQAGNLKEEAGKPFDLTDPSSYRRIADLGSKVPPMVKSLADIVVDIQAHTNEVERAEGGSAQRVPARAGSAGFPTVLVYAGAAALWFWASRKWGKR